MEKTRTLLVVLLAISLTACATAHPGAVSPTGPGFLLGYWHGLIAPYSFVGSLFMDSIAMFATPNIGNKYSFGFLMGVFSWPAIIVATLGIPAR